MVSDVRSDRPAEGRSAGTVRGIKAAAVRRAQEHALAERLSAADVEIAALKSNVAALERRLRTLSRREARARHLAYYDALTGLPNRSLLDDRLHQGLAHAKRGGKQLALMFIDLDGFKGVNDGLGHVHGDKLLQAVAARLVRCTREGDTACRYGGDEFVVLLMDIGGGQPTADISAKIKARLAEPYLIEGRWTRISCSVGTALYPRDAEDFSGLMQAADSAMYRSKRAVACCRADPVRGLSRSAIGGSVPLRHLPHEGV